LPKDGADLSIVNISGKMTPQYAIVTSQDDQLIVAHSLRKNLRIKRFTYFILFFIYFSLGGGLFYFCTTKFGLVVRLTTYWYQSKG
jgi:hypothetical protein